MTGSIALDQRLRELFARIISREAADSLTVDSTTDDVAGWDSTSFVAMILAIEQEFDIEVSALEALRLQSVSGILEMLREKGCAG